MKSQKMHGKKVVTLKNAELKKDVYFRLQKISDKEMTYSRTIVKKSKKNLQGFFLFFIFLYKFLIWVND